ncbi:MAG: hypothetical protein CEE38_20500 [Planctomycetes bacterium B3_Pla]|nr:MAG: hypothetical protein CEE38_20500 [Planctomycetes bacterium B3_Pla]
MRKIAEFWASLKMALALSRVGCVGKLQPPERLDIAIRLEQARVDRNQHAFSLVLFNTGDLEANGAAAQSLVRSLASRIRATDKIGWFDRHRIGVLLPYTLRDGAQKFVDDIREVIGEEALPPGYAIYTYPSQWYSDNGDGHSGQLHFADICRRWSSTGPPRSSALPRHNTSTRSLSAPGPSTTDILDVYGESVTTLKPLVFSPLPAWKRAMDVVGALFGLVVLSPFLLLIALIIKTVSPGPVFFKQQRIGHGGKMFTMLKFRTMQFGNDTSTHKNYVKQLINGANNGDSKSPMIKLENHPQIILFGKILRKTCIDELPQLINVLLGEMSLVGPRPPLAYEVEEFLKWQHRRFDVLPGMTGMWQVSGKNRLTFSEMVRLDIQYSRRRSLWLDLIILLKTPSAIISQMRDSLVLQRRQRLILEGENA